jgi:hypothetical protein
MRKAIYNREVSHDKGRDFTLFFLELLKVVYCGSTEATLIDAPFLLLLLLPVVPTQARGLSTGGGGGWWGGVRRRATWAWVARWRVLCAWVGWFGGAWACLLRRPDRRRPWGCLQVAGVSPTRGSTPGFLPDVGSARDPRPRAVARSEGGRLASCCSSTVLPLRHGSPFFSGGTVFGPWCGSDNGSSSRPVASVGRGSPVRTTEPRSGCTLGPSLTELAVVAGEGPGLDLSWFDPMSVEVTAGRRSVPYDVPRYSPPVAQVVPRHLSASTLVSVVAASRSPAMVPVRSVFSRLSASFSGFSPRQPVGGGFGGLPLLLGRLLLVRSSQLPLPRRTARHVVVRRRGHLWSLRSSLWAALSCLGGDVHSPRAVASAVPASSVVGVTLPVGCAPAGGGDSATVRELVVDFCALVL